MKTSPLRREAVYYLYAYRTIKSELMAPSVAQTPEQDADDIEAAVFGQAHEGTAVKTSGISTPTQRIAMARINGRAYRIAIDTNARVWVEAIENAWADLLANEPLTAQVMEMTYHLRSGEHANHGRMFMRDYICGELGINKGRYDTLRRYAIDTVLWHRDTIHCRKINTNFREIF